jgi:hypothetical protein
MLMTALILAGSLPGGLAPGIWILRATADELPVPPIPPADRPPADIAPVPNVSAQAPVAPASEEPSVDVKLYRAKPYDPGLGFTPGSRYQTNEDRKPIQTPGLSISVPLK